MDFKLGTLRVIVLAFALVDALSHHLIGVDCFSVQGKSWMSSKLEPLVRSRSSASNSLRTAPSITHRRRRQILSLRQLFKEGDENCDDISSQNFHERSNEEISLRGMVKNSREDLPATLREDRGDDLTRNYRNYDMTERYSAPVEKGLRNGRPKSYANSFDENIDFYEDEDEKDPMAGNFWSNPVSRLDPPSDEITRRGLEKQKRSYDTSDNDDERRQRPQRRPRQQERQRTPRRRSPTQSGLGQPPQIFKDFYERLFWYGFDVDDSAEVGDNTVFGGTKGKFSGFNYLLAEQNDDKNQRYRPSRRIPPSRMNDGDAIVKGYNDNGRADYRDYIELEDLKSENKLASSSLYTPPTDQTSTRYDYFEDYDDYESDDNELTSSRQRIGKNSARYDGEAEYMDRRSGGRRRRRQQTRSLADWFPLGMIESFLGMDREEMNYKADLYNSKMGLGELRRSERNERRRSPQRRKSTRDNPEIEDYTYRYDMTLEDESMPILDIDPAEDGDSESMVSRTRRRLLSTDVGSDGDKKPVKRERSWEERQIAMERVPPVDIMAWGPSGELPMSAREKAFIDAQEDIETARRNLNLMKKKECEAKEEITILKIDAERQRLKLSDSPPERRSHRDIEILRQIELEIDDASRNLRRCRTNVDRAFGKLEEFEERHHAIMSCYNIDQASILIGESLNQFSATVKGTNTSKITQTSNVKNSDVINRATDGETNNAISDNAEN